MIAAFIFWSIVVMGFLLALIKKDSLLPLIALTVGIFAFFFSIGQGYSFLFMLSALAYGVVLIFVSKTELSSIKTKLVVLLAGCFLCGGIFFLKGMWGVSFFVSLGILVGVSIGYFAYTRYA